MSHWAQEKKLKDVKKATMVIISRKTSQEENEELRARNFPANGATGGTRTYTLLLYICAHCPLRYRNVGWKKKKFPKSYFDIEIRIYTKLAQKEKHEILVKAN